MSIDYLDTHEGQLSALPIGYREHKMLISNLGRVMKAELNDVEELIMEGPASMQRVVGYAEIRITTLIPGILGVGGLCR